MLWAGAFGVGANMALRHEFFISIGLFDVALNVGTPSGGGGDIEMFHRLAAPVCMIGLTGGPYIVYPS